MRRAPILTAVLVFSVLGLPAGLPAVAAATPTITATAAIVPIPKNPRINGGPTWCPLESFASSPGEASGVVSFGGERVHEQVAVQGFFNSGGGLIFQIVGSTPVSLEEFATLVFANGPSGPIATAAIPLIETLPGADAASAEQFKIKIGAAFKRGKKLVSFGTVPNTCRGHLTGKAEVTFYSGETVPISVTVPCPKATSRG